MKKVLLYFGSFNPIHKGHIALAEWVVEQSLCDELIFIVSPQNPLKSSTELAPEFSRYEMCEMACASSRYPEKIKVSAVEFVLEKPSYTINTLRYLRGEFGGQMQFSILLGADNIENFDRWREYEEILRDYPLYVYPREGYSVEKFADKITFLAEAPLFDFAATDIRKAITNNENFTAKVCPAVARYIIDNRLYK
jgi:nicotinate-nucleotide adenylyltransferase